jgi:CRISPR/Cas system CSM-associated protein Csm5 (group 7 of RAMP superfamily)
MRESINQNYDLVMQILSPVYVGAGKEKEWVKGIDYFYDEDNQLVYFINQEKLFQRILEKGDNLDTYFAAISKGDIKKFHNYIFHTLKFKYKELSDIPPLHYPYTPDAEIKTCIKTALGQPYIPGSSLKGAIRSVLFHYLFNQEAFIKNTWNQLKDDACKLENSNDRNRAISRANSEIQEKVFGKIENNLMRFIRFTDAIFEQTELIPAKTFNLHNKGNSWEAWWKYSLGSGNNEPNFETDGFVFLFESYKVGSQADLRIGFADGVLNFIQSNRERIPKYVDKFVKSNALTFLFKVINDYTRKFIDKEINFFNTYKNEQTAAILAYWCALRDEIEKSEQPNSALLRMSSGSGFYSITGDWRFSNHLSTIADGDSLNNEKRYKSRRLGFMKDEEDFKFMPFGFVRLVKKDEAATYSNWKQAFDERYHEYLNNPPQNLTERTTQKSNTSKAAVNPVAITAQPKQVLSSHQPQYIDKSDLDKNPNQVFECQIIEGKKTRIFVKGLASDESQLVIPKHINYQPKSGEFLRVTAKQFNKERTKVTQVEFIAKI